MSRTANEPTPLRICLVRHGETEWSVSGKHTGVTDIPLTSHGEDEARELGRRLCGIQFSQVLTSPRKRALRTCELADLKPDPALVLDLVEWDYGDYEGRRSKDILQTQPGWNVFLDGAPNGETPAQVADRADRLIARLLKLNGNVALFTHGHFGRALAVRWIGLPVTQGQHFQLGIGSLSILGFDPHRLEMRVMVIWSSSPKTEFELGTEGAIDRWENEGGEVLAPSPSEPSE